MNDIDNINKTVDNNTFITLKPFDILSAVADMLKRTHIRLIAEASLSMKGTLLSQTDVIHMKRKENSKKEMVCEYKNCFVPYTRKGPMLQITISTQ